MGVAISGGRDHVIEGKESKTLSAAIKFQQNMLFAARGRGTVLMMPRPLLGCQIKAEI